MKKLNFWNIFHVLGISKFYYEISIRWNFPLIQILSFSSRKITKSSLQVVMINVLLKMIETLFLYDLITYS